MLAAMVASQKAPTVLLGDIQQHVVKKAALPNDRRQDVIHPSEMAKTDWCPRATAYRISGVEPTDEKKQNGHHLETIFQEGHDIHYKWQTWLGEMGRLWGKWQCTMCEHTAWGLSSLMQYCAECLNPMRYAEVPLDAQRIYGIVGHADGAVPDVKAFIEIKSVGLGTVRMEEPDLVREYTKKTEDGKSIVDYDGLWKGLKRPLLSHRKQAGIYLAIAKALGWDFDSMVFIYENKANQQVKEFRIKYQDDLIEPLLDSAKDVMWAVENGRELPRPESNTRQLKPCSDCVFRSHCWGEEDNGKVSDPEPDAGTRARKPRSEARSRPAADSTTCPSGRRHPRTTGGSHRTVRQHADDAVHADDALGGVPGESTGGSRGRRTVRRSRT